MMSLTFGLFSQVRGSGPLGPLVCGKNMRSFCGKNMRSFCSAKASLIVSTKISVFLVIKS